MAQATPDLAFACDCGILRGRLVGATPSNGNRVDCYCNSCRDAELFAGQPDPAPGPVELYQSHPKRVKFDAGLDQLAVFSFSDQGILRWQAKCCGATLFNTLRKPKVAFATIRTDRLEDPSVLGPVRTRAFVKMPDGKTRNEGFARAVIKLITNALPSRLTGGWKETPFFDIDTLEPVREVYVVSKAERAALPRTSD